MVWRALLTNRTTKRRLVLRITLKAPTLGLCFARRAGEDGNHAHRLRRFPTSTNCITGYPPEVTLRHSTGRAGFNPHLRFSSIHSYSPWSTRCFASAGMRWICPLAQFSPCPRSNSMNCLRESKQTFKDGTFVREFRQALPNAQAPRPGLSAGSRGHSKETNSGYMG